MIKLNLWLLLLLYLWLSQREREPKRWWLFSLLNLGLAMTIWLNVTWLSLLLLLVAIGTSWFVDRKITDLVLAGFLVLSLGCYFIWPVALPSLLLAGIILVNGLYYQQQSNLSVTISIVLFELVLSGLLIFSEAPIQFFLLLLFWLSLFILQQLFAYLFQETDMVYARSLDQIMANYIEEVNLLYQNVRGWRHDYHSHLQALKAYLEQGQVVEIKSYLNQLEDSLVEIDQIVKSGNTMLDAIVNSKLSLASQKEIPMNVKVFVGQQPLINDVDLCVILGNVLDNGIEACEEVEDPSARMLRVYISILKQQMYISVTNSRPLSQEIQENYSSTKNDKRGLGIRRINQLVAKYDGVINRQYEEEVFVTEILLPLATISER